MRRGPLVRAFFYLGTLRGGSCVCFNSIALRLRLIVHTAPMSFPRGAPPQHLYIGVRWLIRSDSCAGTLKPTSGLWSSFGALP